MAHILGVYGIEVPLGIAQIMDRVQNIRFTGSVVAEQTIYLRAQLHFHLWVVLKIEQLQPEEAHADAIGLGLGHFGYFCRPQKWFIDP